MIIWILAWWLLGVLITYGVFHRQMRWDDFERATIGDVLRILFFPLIWPLVLVYVAIEDDWLDLPIFDLDWFRKGKKDE